MMDIYTKKYYDELAQEICDVITRYQFKTDERVAEIEIRKDIDDKYVVTPILGEPEYADEVDFK